MRVFLSGVILLFVGFFLGVSVTAVIAQEDSREKAIKAILNKPTKLEMYYDLVETFKNATGPSLNERGESVDFTLDCLNDGYCGFQGTKSMAAGSAQMFDKCQDYFKYKDPSNYNFDDNDPKNYDLIIRKYEDEVDAAICSSFFSGLRMAAIMDYTIRVQNGLSPPLLCIDLQSFDDTLYKNYIDFFDSPSTYNIGLYRAVYMVLAESGQFCDPESVGLE